MNTNDWNSLGSTRQLEYVNRLEKEILIWKKVNKQKKELIEALEKENKELEDKLKPEWRK